MGRENGGLHALERRNDKERSLSQTVLRGVWLKINSRTRSGIITTLKWQRGGKCKNERKIRKVSQYFSSSFSPFPIFSVQTKCQTMQGRQVVRQLDRRTAIQPDRQRKREKKYKKGEELSWSRGHQRTGRCAMQHLNPRRTPLLNYQKKAQSCIAI